MSNTNMILKTLSISKALNGSIYIKYVNTITGEVKERSGEYRPTHAEAGGEYFRFWPIEDKQGRPSPLSLDYPSDTVGGMGYRIDYMD